VNQSVRGGIEGGLFVAHVGDYSIGVAEIRGSRCMP
jgi:hypothetical protein